MPSTTKNDKDKKISKKEAEKKSKSKRNIKEITEGAGAIGTYKENTGGGEPIDGGGRGQWERNDYKEKRVPDQPRTNDGKFTYNAVNNKPLKEISKSHGKSRGTTVPPTLTGGVNGVDEDIFKRTDDGSGNLTRSAASKLYEKFEGEFYKKSTIFIDLEGKKMSKKFSEMSYIDAMKLYTGVDLSKWVKDDSKPQLSDEEWKKLSVDEKKHYGYKESGKTDEDRTKYNKNLSDKDFKGQDIAGMKSKKGRDSAAEIFAKKLAEKTGKGQIVMDAKTGLPSVFKKMADKGPKQFEKPADQTGQHGEETSGAGENVTGTVKYSDTVINAVRSKLAAAKPGAGWDKAPAQNISNLITKLLASDKNKGKTAEQIFLGK